MIDMSFNATKRVFFDRQRVIQAVDKATRDNLSKFGAFVRQRSKTSLKYRRAASFPGSPPSAHRTMARKKVNRRTGTAKTQSVSPLRELIFFAYDEGIGGQHNVVIGPILFNQTPMAAKAKRTNNPIRRTTVPSVLEFGGHTLFTGSRGNARMVSIAARPFMRPAFEEEKRKLPGIWANSVKG